MRVILVALTGFLVGSAMAAAVALIPLTTSAAAPAAAPSSHMGAAVMSNGMAMGTSARPTLAGAQIVSLTIQHLQRGCHVWSNGKTTGAMMRLHLKRGQTLSIMDMDVDAHRMTQLAGPMHMQMGGPMMTSHGMKMTFTKKGTYRFGTRTVEMAGMTDVRTIGPDNKLRLAVTVA
jgi:hypothetical protein